MILGLLGRGEVLGEMSAIEESPVSASVITLEKCEVLTTERARFLELLHSTPQILMNLLKIQNRRMRRLTSRAEALATLDVEGRIAWQLLAFARQYAEAQYHAAESCPTILNCCTLPVRLTQPDLAALVGASLKQVRRVMTNYRQAGLISVDSNHHITLHNPQSLQQLCS
jgi:CRP-like cAMP-binding protein